MMQRFDTLQRWRWELLAIMAVTIALFALAVALNSSLGALLVALLAIIGVALVVSRSFAVAPSAAARPAPRAANVEAMPLHSLVTAEGEVIEARLVPLDQPAGHRFLLTPSGYLLLDAQGRVIYTLK